MSVVALDRIENQTAPYFILVRPVETNQVLSLGRQTAHFGQSCSKFCVLNTNFSCNNRLIMAGKSRTRSYLCIAMNTVPHCKHSLSLFTMLDSCLAWYLISAILVVCRCAAVMICRCTPQLFVFLPSIAGASEDAPVIAKGAYDLSNLDEDVFPSGTSKMAHSPVIKPAELPKKAAEDTAQSSSSKDQEDGENDPGADDGANQCLQSSVDLSAEAAGPTSTDSSADQASDSLPAGAQSEALGIASGGEGAVTVDATEKNEKDEEQEASKTSALEQQGAAAPAESGLPASKPVASAGAQDVEDQAPAQAAGAPDPATEDADSGESKSVNAVTAPDSTSEQAPAPAPVPAPAPAPDQAPLAPSTTGTGTGSGTSFDDIPVGGGAGNNPFQGSQGEYPDDVPV